MNHQLEIQTKGVIGIYFLFDFDGKCCYVGKADCIFSRLKTHFQNNFPIKEVGWTDFTDSVKNLKHIEAKWFLRWKENLAIKQRKPYLNKTNPFSNLNNVYRFWMDAPDKVKKMMVSSIPSLAVTK
jgi:hypothetical protein